MKGLSKEEAREVLNELVTSGSFLGFPVDDVVIKRFEQKEGLIEWDEKVFGLNCYSFRDLIKTAYNLKDA